MASNRSFKRFDKKIKDLKDELQKIDEIMKKNAEDLRGQIQIGLHGGRRISEGSPMWDTLIDRITLECEEIQIKLDSGFKPINPQFEYQRNQRWIEIQKEFHERSLKAMKENLMSLQSDVEKVKQAIAEQTERIKSRRVQIIEELQKIGVNTSEFANPPDYIG